MTPVSPELQAMIDQDFVPVPLELSQDKVTALCSAHKLEKCDNCQIDFVNLNKLSKLLAANPSILCPPPSNVVSQKLTQAVTSIKEEGNTAFKSGHTAQAIAKYSTAVQMALQRPPWEAHQFMREELSTVISNRSAAYFDKHDNVHALADAETVISIRRNWGKGHFRKAKALLGLGRLREAAESVRRGLDYDPDSSELLSFLGDIERVEKKLEEKKLEARHVPAATVTAPA